MTKFYEIVGVNGSVLINLAMVVELVDITVEEGSEAQVRVHLVNGTHKDVLKHSLMMALHHSETPYMLMSPPESEAGDLSEVSDEDVVEVTDK